MTAVMTAGMAGPVTIDKATASMCCAPPGRFAPLYCLRGNTGAPYPHPEQA